MLRNSFILRFRRECLGLARKDVRQIHRDVRPTLYLFTSRKRKQELKQTVPTPPSPRYTYAEWNYDAEIFAFGARIGERFKDELLREALTDSSYVNKEKLEQEKLGLGPSESFLVDFKGNDELAKNGEIIIQDVIEKFLRFNFPNFPSQGIQAVNNFLSSDQILSELALGIGCKDIILTIEYPPEIATLAKVFKALVAAIDLSSKELGLQQPRAELFVLDFVAAQLYGKDVNEIWDIAHPWKLLNEIRENKGLDPLEPRILRQAGQNTILSAYVIGLYDSNRALVATGIGETVDIAHEMAARDALKVLFGTKNQKLLFDIAIRNYLSQ